MTFLLLTLALFFDIRGVVVDPAGRPVEGVSVECGTATATTDREGAFSMAGDQTCTATITKEGFAVTSTALKPNQTNRVELPVATLTERVVVSATGAPVSIEEAGISATVFTAQDLKVRNYAPVREVLRDASGVTVVQTGSGGGTTSVFSRGGESDSTLVLLDGIPLTDPGGALNYANLTSAGLSRIEMARGPQSALYGAEASSGIIQLFSTQGNSEASVPHGSLSYDRGNFSADHWTAGLGGGLAERIDYYFTVDQNRVTGQFPNNIWRNTTGTANVGFKVDPATTLRGIYRRYDSRTGVPYLTGYQAFDLDGRQHDEDESISFRVDNSIGTRFSQRAYVAYHQLSSVNTNPSAESYTRAVAVRRAAPIRSGTPERVYFDGLVAPGTPGSISRNINTFAGGFQSFTDRTSGAYQGTVSHRGGTFVFGYEYERQSADFDGAGVARRNNGVSLFEQFNWGSRIFFSGGARIEHSSVYGGRFAPRGAVTFRLPTDTYLRLSASRGIKEPSLLETNSPNPFFPGNPVLKPERTDTAEIGLSRTWMDGRFQTEIAYFRNFYENLIQFQSDPVTFIGTWVNADKAWARGLEVSGKARVHQRLTVDASYTKLYTRWVSAGADQGQELLRRPRHSGQYGLTWAPHDNRYTLRLGARYMGERRDGFNAFGINRLDSYSVAYLSANVQVHKNVGLYFNINNLNDEQYQEVTGYQQWGRNGSGGVRLTW